MANKVILKTVIPEQSVLKKDEKLFDYVDCFEGSYPGKTPKNDIIPIVDLFASSGPEWANTLMKIRDTVVKPFGIRTSESLAGQNDQSESSSYEVGSKHGIFKVFDKSENEIIMGEDDGHLNFRVSLLLESSSGNELDKKLSVTTTVKFNNLLGKLYFIPVKPFHKLIVRKSTENILAKLEK